MNQKINLKNKNREKKKKKKKNNRNRKKGPTNMTTADKRQHRLMYQHKHKLVRALSDKAIVSQRANLPLPRKEPRDLLQPSIHHQH